MQRRMFNVVCVEDNEDFAFFLSRAFSKLKGFDISVTLFTRGTDFKSYLSEVRYLNSKNTPDLIMLDINLPDSNGLDLLQSVKEKENTQKIPTIMLSSSSLNSDIQTAYALGSDAFVTKPGRYSELESTLLSICKFYFNFLNKQKF